MVIDSVRTGSFADLQGLEPGLVITHVNRQPTATKEQFDAVVSKLKTGDDVVFEVIDPRHPEQGINLHGRHFAVAGFRSRDSVPPLPQRKRGKMGNRQRLASFPKLVSFKVTGQFENAFGAEALQLAAFTARLKSCPFKADSN